MNPDLVTTGAFAAVGPLFKGLLDSFINRIPSPFRPWASTALSLGLGALVAHQGGLEWSANLLPSLAMAGTAAWHHDSQA